MSTVAPVTHPEAHVVAGQVVDARELLFEIVDPGRLRIEALAFDPALLEQTWAEVKRVMATPSTLDPLTKELVYITASIINGCSYCVHSHTAAATAKGMTREQHAELLAIIALASKTNQLATALQVPVDPVFDRG